MASILRVLAAVLLLALPAGPASAAATPTLEPHLGTITLAPGGADKRTLLWLSSTAEQDTEHTLTVVVDYADVADFAEVELTLADDETSAVARTRVSAADAETCTTDETRITCVWDDIWWDANALAAIALVSATPTAAATTGDEGTIEVSTQIDDGDIATSESTVRVGEGVDLASGEAEDVEAEAGGTATVTPTVRNAGATAVTGLVMLVDADPGLLGESSWSNCRYGDGLIACTFDDELAADSSYVVSEPLGLVPPADSMTGSQAQAVVQWMTATEWNDLSEVLPEDLLGEAGTGDPLTLAVAAAGQDQPQSDVEPVNDSATITLTVTGDEEPDFAAVGARVTAATSDVVMIQVGARDTGPGTLHPDIYPNNRLYAVVILPGNVTAVDVDPRCDESDDYYLCIGTAASMEDDSQIFSFLVRVEESRGEAGAVGVADELLTIGSAAAAAKDVLASAEENNVASIVVTGSGGSGGGLPVTGPGPTGTAAAGAALVLLGALLAVRRIERPVYAAAHRATGRGRRRKGHAR